MTARGRDAVDDGPISPRTGRPLRRYNTGPGSYFHAHWQARKRQVLKVLKSGKSYTTRHLAESCGVTRQAMDAVLSRMLQEGVVRTALVRPPGRGPTTVWWLPVEAP